MNYDLFAFASSGVPAYYACRRIDENTYELDLVAYRPPDVHDRVRLAHRHQSGVMQHSEML